MDKLYPIIRRKRRPLVVEDVPPIPTKVLADGHQSMPVQPVAEKPSVEPAKSTPVTSPKPDKPNDEDTNY
jgi:hypothetical protein